MSETKRILLLEDDPNLGLILQEHLTMRGYQVTLATDGEQGLELFDDRVYCLCLVDVMMPKRDGFSFVEEIRKTDRKTPMIFLTAKSLKEDKIKGFRLGCDDYITKPFFDGGVDAEDWRRPETMRLARRLRSPRYLRPRSLSFRL